jgi:hypothetical protein
LLQADYLTPSHAGVVHGHDLDEFFITPGQQRRTFGDEQRLQRRSPRHLLRRLCSGGPCVSDCGARLRRIIAALVRMSPAACASPRMNDSTLRQVLADVLDSGIPLGAHGSL